MHLGEGLGNPKLGYGSPGARFVPCWRALAVAATQPLPSDGPRHTESSGVTRDRTERHPPRAPAPVRWHLVLGAAARPASWGPRVSSSHHAASARAGRGPCGRLQLDVCFDERTRVLMASAGWARWRSARQFWRRYMLIPHPSCIPASRLTMHGRTISSMHPVRHYTPSHHSTQVHAPSTRARICHGLCFPFLPSPPLLPPLPHTTPPHARPPPSFIPCRHRVLPPHSSYSHKSYGGQCQLQPYPDLLGSAPLPFAAFIYPAPQPWASPTSQPSSVARRDWREAGGEDGVHISLSPVDCFTDQVIMVELVISFKS